MFPIPRETDMTKHTFTSKNGNKVWTAFQEAGAWVARGMFNDGWDWAVDHRAACKTEGAAVSYCEARTT